MPLTPFGKKEQEQQEQIRNERLCSDERQTDPSCRWSQQAGKDLHSVVEAVGAKEDPCQANAREGEQAIQDR